MVTKFDSGTWVELASSRSTADIRRNFLVILARANGVENPDIILDHIRADLKANGVDGSALYDAANAMVDLMIRRVERNHRTPTIALS